MTDPDATISVWVLTESPPETVMYRSRLAFALAMAGLAAILLPSPLPAQITFQRTYGGAADDFGYSVQQTTDGGYLVAGNTRSYGAGGSDVYLAKTNANGDALWTRTYGGTGYDAGFSVLQTSDGDFIIAGVTSSYGAGNGDFYLIKTNGNGDTLWTRTVGGSAAEWGRSVRPTADGGCIATGYTESYGAGSWDVYAVRTSASGDTLWTRTFGGTSTDEGWSVQQTSDSGFVIAGYTKSSGSGNSDVYLVKTDAHGDTSWTRAFERGIGSWDFGCDVQQTFDSGYVITGCTQSEGLDTLDIYLIRTDFRGDTIWTRTYGGPRWEESYSVQQTAEGGLIIVGYTRSFGGNDVYLIKTDACGDTQWTKTYGGASGATGNSVRQTSDGGYIIAGYTDSLGAGDYDVYLIKTDSLGNVAVAEPKASPTRAAALSLSCEPNPFRTRTAISLQLTADSPAELAIFDAGGRRVRTFTVNRTPYTVWDGRDDFGRPLSSGAYFVRLDVAGEHATTRIVLQR
jgi:hypothetical protein